MADEVALLHVEGDGSDGEAMLAGLNDMVNTLRDSLQALADTMNGLSGLGDVFAGMAADMDAFGTAAQQAATYEDDLVASVTGVADALQGQAATAQEIAAAQDELAASVQQAGAAMAEEAGEAASSAASLQENAAASQEAAAAAQENAAAQTEAKDAAAESNSVFSDAAMGMGMLGMAAGMAAKSFLDMGMQAQDSLSVLQGLTGASASDMRTYTSGLEQMATDLGVTLKQASDGMYFVASAGYDAAHGGLTVLREAMMAAKAGGVDTMTVADALTSVMRSYGASANQAGNYTDMLIAAVTQGKQSFQDLAASIGPAAVTGKEAGFSFQEVAGAEALMTQSGFDAHRAVMDLDFLMRAVGVNASNVAKQAQSMGLQFNFTAFQSMNLSGRLQYLQSQTIGNADAFVNYAKNMPNASMAQLEEQAKSLGVQFNASAYESMNASQRLQYLAQISSNARAEFEKLVGGANGLMAASILTQNAGQNYAHMMDAVKNSTGSTAKAFEVSERTISAAGQHIQASLSVVAFQVIQAITPVVAPIFTHIADALGYLASHADIAIPILAALGTLIGGTLVVGLGALAVALLGPVAPILAIVAGISALVGIVVLLVTHWQQLTAAFSDKGPLSALGSFFGLIKQMAEYIGGAFMDAVRGIGSTLGPVFAQLGQTFQEFLPTLKLVGIFIGGLLGVLGTLVASNLVGMISAAFQMLGQILSGVVSMLSGLAQIVMGVLTVIKGLFETFIGLLTGNKQMILDGFHQIFDGLGSILRGALTFLTGLLQATLGAIVQGILGFARGFLGTLGHIVGMIPTTFTHGLGQALQGISHFVESAVQLVASLPGRFIGWITSLVNGVIHWFQHLFDTLIGHSIIPDMISGIVSAFFGLPGKILGMLAGFVGHVIGQFMNMAKQGLQWIGNLAHQGISFLGNLASQGLHHITSFVSSTFSTLGTWVHNGISQAGNFVRGILNSIHPMPTQMNQMLQLAKDNTTLRMEEMKLASINAMLAQKTAVLAHLHEQADGIVREMQTTKDESVRRADEQKLAVIQAMEEQQQKAVNAAQDMRDKYTSKVTDMKNRVNTEVTSMKNQTSNTFTNLASNALTWGSHLAQNIGNGIQNAAGWAINAAKNLASSIASFLHFTKPDQGPLADVDTWMPHFGDLLQRGLQNQVGKLKGASLSVAAQLAQAAPSSATVSNFNNANTFLNAHSNNSQVVAVLQQIAALLQQQANAQQQAGRSGIGGGPLNANLPAVNQYNTFQLGGNTNLQQLYQQLNTLAGRSNEYGLRGAPSGLM